MKNLYGVSPKIVFGDMSIKNIIKIFIVIRLKTIFKTENLFQKLIIVTKKISIIAKACFTDKKTAFTAKNGKPEKQKDLISKSYIIHHILFIYCSLKPKNIYYSVHTDKIAGGQPEGVTKKRLTLD